MQFSCRGFKIFLTILVEYELTHRRDNEYRQRRRDFELRLIILKQSHRGRDLLLPVVGIV